MISYRRFQRLGRRRLGGLSLEWYIKHYLNITLDKYIEFVHKQICPEVGLKVCAKNTIFHYLLLSPASVYELYDYESISKRQINY